MSEYPPIFILGRQHSGNTMLATVLGRVPGVLSFSGEGQFFDNEVMFDHLKLENRIAAIVRALAHSESPPLAAPISANLNDHLRRWASEKRGPKPSAAELYALSMDWVADSRGMRRWSQKATSYIFYVPRILKVFPGAQLIFLLRNPFDLLASQIRRNSGHICPADLLKFALGWNKGIKLGLDYALKRPLNFLLVKYEDLVAEPAAVFLRLFRFLQIDFDPTYLDIPHVNRSETPYNVESEKRGINSSRVHYYRQVISPGNERRLRALISRDLLRKTYPQLCEAGDASSWSLDSTWVWARGICALVGQQTNLALREPANAINRFWHKIK